MYDVLYAPTKVASLPSAGIVIKLDIKQYNDVVATIAMMLYLTIGTDVHGETLGNCEL